MELQFEPLNSGIVFSFSTSVVILFFDINIPLYVCSAFEFIRLKLSTISKYTIKTVVEDNIVGS